jgi:hypothetical protein
MKRFYIKVVNVFMLWHHKEFDMPSSGGINRNDNIAFVISFAFYTKMDTQKV